MGRGSVEKESEEHALRIKQMKFSMAEKDPELFLRCDTNKEESLISTCTCARERIVHARVHFADA